MSCDDNDDMDVVVQIRKISTSGKMLTSINFPVPVTEDKVPDFNVAKYLGPQGMLRASHSVSRDDTKTSCNGQLIHYQHDRAEKIPRSTIVPLDITLWPLGMVFDKGEGIVLRIAGHDMALPELPIPPIPFPEPPATTHIILPFL